MTENTPKNVVAMPMTTPTESTPFDFAPSTFKEVMDLCDMLAKSTMVPKDYIGKPGNCYIGMKLGAELGLQPLQSLQTIAVINGKPGVYGDGGKALLIRHGFKIEEWDTKVIKEKGYAQCTISRADRAAVTRTFSKENAVVAKLWGKDGPWTNYPERQMAWRAFWFAARDIAADVLKGIVPAEELRDMEVEVTGEVVSRNGDHKEEDKEVISDKARELIKLFEATMAPEEVKAALAKSATESGSLSLTDKAKINSAYRKSVERVRAKNASGVEAEGEKAAETGAGKENNASPAPDPLSDQQVFDKLAAAKDRSDADQVCADFINPLEAGDRKAALLQMYAKRVAEFA